MNKGFCGAPFMQREKTIGAGSEELRDFVALSPGGSMKLKEIEVKNYKIIGFTAPAANQGRLIGASCRYSFL
ncbi:MAG: hypothetical protein WA592_06215, partial [Pseudolabrys sp.]